MIKVSEIMKLCRLISYLASIYITTNSDLLASSLNELSNAKFRNILEDYNLDNNHPSKFMDSKQVELLTSDVAKLTKKKRTNSLSCQSKSRGTILPSKNMSTFTNFGDWSEMRPSRWRDAMYKKGGYFSQLSMDTLSFIRDKSRKYLPKGYSIAHVEVGCGTGEVLLGVANLFSMNIGIDINEDFLKFSRKQIPDGIGNPVYFLNSCATDLRRSTSKYLHGSKVVVSCVNNTMGVFPDSIKEQAYSEMRALAGKDGIVIIGFWNAKYFRNAIENFYKKNSLLCGEVTLDSVDYTEHTMETESGYHTHWSTLEEARNTLEDNGFDVIESHEIGLGILCVCQGN